MTRYVLRYGFTLAALCALVGVLAPVRPARAEPPHASPLAPQDIPEVLVHGVVDDFTRVDTTLYWHSYGLCYTPPAGPNGPAVNLDVPEAVTRTSTIYASPTRNIYSKDLRATNSCNQYVFSRVVADANYLYWVDATGLVKVPKTANPGDLPPVLNASFNDQQPYQIAVGIDYVYVSRDGYSVCGQFCFFNPSILYKVNKATGVATGLDCTFTVLGYTCPYAVNPKVDPGERYLYYMELNAGTYDLKRMDLSSPTTIATLSTQVHSYYPEGYHIVCIDVSCFTYDYVFIGRGAVAQGQTHEIVRYSNLNGSSAVIYTSAASYDASINDIVADDNEIFFYEVREDVPCSQPCFQTYTAWLYRSGRSNASSLANIYQYPAGVAAIAGTYNLDEDGTKVYWKEQAVGVKRLSNNATALPKSPMHAVGLEVTQGVQTTGNNVPLIRGKRTFVRLYVQSDDSTRDVPGVTARLSATWTGGSLGGVGGPIAPGNLYAITVKRAPKRGQLNEAFLFEVPWDWLNGDNITFSAELNPAHNPEQTDNYVNNSVSAGPFHLNPPPRLEVRFFQYYYSMGGKVWGPDNSEKFGNADWIRRAYPVDESPGTLHVPGGGLRWDATTIVDNALADRVRYPSVPCGDSPLPDCQNLRATAYIMSQVSAMRDGFKAWGGDTDNTTYYGLVTGGSELRGNPPMTVTYFTRGQDGGKNGAGPAGAGWLGWYAGHEVGHSVGMGHPSTAGTECGIDSSDPSPTYPHAHIGANDDTTNVEGFLDTPSYNYPRYDNANLAAGSKTFDVMAYCLPQWLSDQNYKRIYQNLAGVAPTMPQSPRVNGDWIKVYGGIYSGTNSASIDVLQHVVGDATLPPLAAGNYAIRLRNLSGTLLQEYAFTPQGDGDASLLLYGQVVAYVAGTRTLQIVRLGDQAVLASRSVSANSPSMGAVGVISGGVPVTGVVTLNWSASHPDGLPLQFDVHYSRDGGLTFQPLVLHTVTPTLQVDTAGLGGGTGVFRVIASDGFNSAYADSPPFPAMPKPPVPVILLPANGIHVHYGQVVNFSGMALDPQDGMVDNAALIWSLGQSTLGAGPLLSQSLLPPGTDVIVLTALNGQGLMASTSVTVTVDDNIDPDGPLMQVTPGTITWHIGDGVTAVQTQTMGVANVGRGSVTWNASSNVGWLTLSQYSGSDGTTLTASGDPTGLKSGDTRSGMLAFTTTSGGYTQTVQVPVQLIRGNIYQNSYMGPQPPPLFNFLPLIRR